MTHIFRRRRIAVLVAAQLMVTAALAAPAPAAAMQILDAADHAELAAEISATQVNRIALAGDRIARVVRAPGGFAVEHDARSGDLYLRPAAPTAAENPAGEPITLFVGTEKGFTYRLTLTPADRESEQILIRNAGAVPGTAAARPSAADTHIAALMRLVRAVARREPLPGHDILAGGETPVAGFSLIETWRSPHLAALVFEAERPASEDADGLAGLAGTRMAAATERRDLLDGNAPTGAGVAFPPLKRRLRSIAPDKAAEGWLARFRALAGPAEERRRPVAPDAGQD